MLHWTGAQWIMFGCFAVAGLAGFGLVALQIVYRRDAKRVVALARRVPDWGRNAPHLAAAPVVPMLTGTPATLVEAIPFNPPPGWDDPSTGVPIDDAWVRAHLLPGPGSLTTLRETEERDTLITITHADLVDPDVEREVGGALDAVLAEFRAEIEPAMRKARLWMLQGHGHHATGGAAHAWSALDQWRIDTPTGEYRLVDRPEYQRAVAEAALVAL